VEFRWNEWNAEHLAQHGIEAEAAEHVVARRGRQRLHPARSSPHGERETPLPEAATMNRKKSLVAKYERMTPGELREATKAFDKEMIVEKSRPLTVGERKAWETARRKPGRPRRGGGVKVISVSVERGLLARSDALARELGVSRAALIERGLRAVLGAGERP
jgi:hypothetical protein